MKPFDWELQEDADAPTEAGEIPAEMLKPFDWESNDIATSADSENGQAATPWEEALAEQVFEAAKVETIPSEELKTESPYAWARTEVAVEAESEEQEKEED